MHANDTRHDQYEGPDEVPVPVRGVHPPDDPQWATQLRNPDALCTRPVPVDLLRTAALLLSDYYGDASPTVRDLRLAASPAP